MSSYLSNLASRTLEQRPSIRPRLASLFEPASGPRNRVAEPPAAKRSSPSQPVSRDDPSTLPPRLLEADAKRSPIHQPAEPSPEAAQLSQHHRDHRPKTSDFLTERSRQAITPHVTVVSNTELLLERRDPATPPPESSRGDQPVQAASPEYAYQSELEAAHSPGTALTERTLAVQTAVSVPVGQTLAEAVTSRAQPESHRGLAVIVRPNVATNYESLTPQIETPSFTREAPSSVRITIGRVEVRAIMPPAQFAAPARETKRGSSLSLEDYLQKRNGAKT